MAQPWPDPHPEHGPAMSKPDIAGYLGLAGKDTVEAWITRTRQGKAPVPFPAPDGVAVPPEGKPRKGIPYWWQATIDAHQRRRNESVKRAKTSVETIHRARRLLIDGMLHAEVARTCNLSTATVSRIANGKLGGGPPVTPPDALAEDLPMAGR